MKTDSTQHKRHDADIAGDVSASAAAENVKSGQDESAAGGKGIKGLVERLTAKGMNFYKYVTDGVWNDTRSSFKVNFIKTVNLSVRSFLNSELQMRAGFLTYQTLLAIVPALALVFAIGRGFGFQNILQSQLFNSFPAQKEALSQAFKFVDSYLAQSSEGVFLGVGILFLLWTLISLLSNVEACFNTIWGIKQGRTIYRKLTDYTAILLILPIIMICASGIMVLMSTTIRTILPFGFLGPLVEALLDLLSLALIWLFFAGSYMLIPNTKVKFKNAMLAGCMAGTAYMILQWLFVSGQMYVTKYNAIYGSFSFLPLLLIWLQLVWVITLAGGVLCFSSQNIFEFSFSNEIARISNNYKWRLTLAVMTIAVDRFMKEERPLTPHQIAVEFGLPISLVTDSVHRLVEAGLLERIVGVKPTDEPSVAPAIDPHRITVGEVMKRLGEIGSGNFIPEFNSRFSQLSEAVVELRRKCIEEADHILLMNLEVTPVDGHTHRVGLKPDASGSDAGGECRRPVEDADVTPVSPL